MESSVEVRRLRLPSWHLPSDFVFWVALLALNTLLFLPAFLLTQESSSWLPVVGAEETWWQALIARPNYDMFRLNLELFVFALLWLTVRPLRRKWIVALFTVIYLLAFVYYVYEAISVFVFFMDPVFYSQSHMILEGVPFLLESAGLSWPVYIGAVLLLVAFFGGVYLLVRTITEHAQPTRLSRGSQVTLMACGGLALLSLILYRGQLASPDMSVSRFFAKMDKNIIESMKIYQEVGTYNDDIVFETYDYAGKDLADKPNIYLIFVESYGSVLYKRNDWVRPYRALLADVEEELADDGWTTASALSEAPIWGGGSWMSYTSGIFGLRIDNDAEYLTLFDLYQERDYPHLGNYMRDQGYHYAWLTAISSELKADKSVQYENFYNFDSWVRFPDLNYEGPMVSWGPAPLDQYSLNFARQKIEAETDQPILFYTITQNSHYPWYVLPDLAEDWRDLNDPDYPQPDAPPELIEHQAKRQNYFNAIRYELKMLSDFIRNDSAEDSIFILIGDHQPPQVSRRSDGWDTPIHIVSRNADFVESFAEYGFDLGMGVEEVAPVMHHEGLYSLLVRQLLTFYGEKDVELPDYLPNGVPFEAAEEEAAEG
ncbi:MAG: sulfatase-like hydrolase/transferase [Caldilineaceae bacterium]|nr:sulfatase-like hydrolase/transferase [Caldilineaceae bacterium]